MSALRWLQLVIGLALVWIVLRDLFVGVIVPRPARGSLRPSNLLIKWSWQSWRWIGNRSADVLTRESRLGAFGPAALILLLVAWVVGLIIGYGAARGLSRSIYQLSVRVRDMAHRLDQDVASVSIEADGDLSVTSQQSVTIQAGTQLQLKGGSGAKLDGGPQVEVTGGMIKLN